MTGAGSGGGGPSGPLLARAWQAGLVVLATALVARVAWELLAPLVPGLLTGLVLIRVVGFVLRGRR